MADNLSFLITVLLYHSTATVLLFSVIRSTTIITNIIIGTKREADCEFIHFHIFQEPPVIPARNQLQATEEDS